MTILSKRLTPKRLRVDDGEVNKFSVNNGEKITKKSGKSSKSQKSAKLKKKLSKSGNSPNFGATEAGPKFLTLSARTAFNCLRLAFTKAPIL